MRLFLFAIGGTGSRVLKSLLMLSAAGVRPLDENGKPVKDLEIVPVIIDPHKANEDLKRTEAMLNDYRDIRRKLYGNEPNADGFFANRIVTLREIMSNTSVTLNDTFIFNLGAVENSKFREFIGYDTMNEANQALTSLLFASSRPSATSSARATASSSSVPSLVARELRASPSWSRTSARQPVWRASRTVTP